MGAFRPAKGKAGGGKGGKAAGKHAQGKAGAAAVAPQLEIKECRVDLGEESRDEVLDLIRHLADARGGEGDAEAAEAAEADKNAVDTAGAEDDSEEEEEELLVAAMAGVAASQDEEDEDDDDDDDEDTDEDICPLGWEDSCRLSARCGEKRERRDLLRQLIREDHREAAADAVRCSGRSANPGRGPRHQQLSGRHLAGRHPQEAMVRLFICDAAAIHRKPKGPLLVVRGGAGSVDRLLKKSRQPLGIKGKKALTAYIVGSDGRVARKITNTEELEDDTLVAISTQELKPGPASAPAATEARPEEVAASAAALDAVRAAYEQQGRRRGESVMGVFSKLAADEAAKLSSELQARLRAYRKSDRLQSLRAERDALPAARSRAALARALELSQVVIVVGETGSGKTTQCPNFILEAAEEAGTAGETSIVCTQPRRIAAVSVAARVAQERGEQPGGPIGHAVRLESCASTSTRLLFCTTGVLLQQLNSKPDLDSITHIVVDEAHERNLHTDFLLMLLREVLERRPDLRVIVMSATLEQGLFEKYFEGFAYDPTDDLPVIHIEGRTFPLEIRHLSEVRSALGRPAEGGNGRWADAGGKGGQNQQDDNAAELEAWIRRVHFGYSSVQEDAGILVSPEVRTKPDYDLIADLCALILRGAAGPNASKGGKDEGAILIFLPGFVEIERCLRTLKSHRGVAGAAWLLPLHGSMAIGQQQRVFQRPPEAHLRKIIVSTNIAETSITIDDVTHVIDSGHVRETRYNPQSSMSIFSTCWVSRAAAKQRAGRASRTRPGVCWRLYDQAFLETQLPRHTLCEMRRTALEELVLQLRLLELGSTPGEFLLKAPEPPAPLAVDAAVSSLLSIGALVNTAALPLTALGFHLAHMPMDARVGKMLIYGALCCCLGPMLTIAACMAHRSPFARNFNREREDQQRRKREQRYGHLSSDHLAAVAAYDEYCTAKAKADDGGSAARELCDELGLAATVLDGMAQLRGRFLRHLIDIGFADADGVDGGKGVNKHSADLALVRCMLCAGLFPNVAQVQRQGKMARGPKVILVSRELERCAVHPSSINSRQQEDFAANSGWLLYHLKVKTSQIFLQDSTLVGPIPLLLFGGELRLNKARSHMEIGGISFRTKREATAVLFKMLRREIDRLLLLKITEPRTGLSEMVGPLLATVTRLLQLNGSCVNGRFRS